MLHFLPKTLHFEFQLINLFIYLKTQNVITRAKLRNQIKINVNR